MAIYEIVAKDEVYAYIVPRRLQGLPPLSSYIFFYLVLQ